MSYHFYKAVQHMHIKGFNNFGTLLLGIKVTGLDPNCRNVVGGATSTASATSGRELSEADSTGIGQCLTGGIGYATGYCTSSDHRLLRVTLQDEHRKILVSSTGTRGFGFRFMKDAVAAREVTAIATIPPDLIEYATEDNGWNPIASYPADAKDEDFDELDTDW